MHAMLWAYFPFWINITPIYFCLFVYFLCFLKPQKIILEEKKTGNKGEIMWKIGADFSVTGGEIWLGCNNPSESKTLEENKHRAQNSPCYSLTAASSVDWADEMTFWRTGGKPQGQQQMGGLRVPDPTGAGPLNQLKSHQATLYHTRRDPLERGSDTYSHFDNNVSRSQVLQLCLLLLLEGKGNKNLTVYYFNQHIHRIPKGATSQHLAHCFLGTHCLRPSHAWSRYTCCVLEWHICVRLSNICVPTNESVWRPISPGYTRCTGEEITVHRVLKEWQVRNANCTKLILPPGCKATVTMRATACEQPQLKFLERSAKREQLL